MRIPRSVALVLMALLVSTSVLGACATQPGPAAKQEPVAQQPAAKQEQATPQAAAKQEPAAKQPAAQPAARKAPTDSLTVALSTFEAETFLPWNGGVARQSYLLLIYDVLVYTDPKTGEQLPGLAEKWEMGPDGKSYTFWIRKGVQFNEGWGELTAEDVKYSVERMIGKDSIGSPAAILRSVIDRVEAPEPYKAVIYLKSPLPGLIGGYMNDGNAAGIVVSKKYVTSVGDEKANSHPIGTGPYVLAEEHKKGGPIKLKTVEGVEKHWRVVPEFKNVTFLMIPEEATRVAMLKSGEVDLAPISYDSIDTIKASGLNVLTIEKNWAPLIRFGGLVSVDPKRYNPNNPWAKKEVRQALNYAIDKEAIAKSIFKGQAVPTGASMPLDPWFGIEPYPYDPQKAKQLLAQAGYPNGFPLTLKTLTANPGAELPTIGQAVATYWKAIGVDVKIVPTDWGAVRGDLMAAKANDYLFTQRGQPFIDPIAGLGLEYQVSNAWTIYATKESMDLFDRISNELDDKKRAQLTEEMGRFAREEATNVFLVFANEPYGASKKVGKWPTIRMRPQNIESITHP